MDNDPARAVGDVDGDLGLRLGGDDLLDGVGDQFIANKAEGNGLKSIPVPGVLL